MPPVPLSSSLAQPTHSTPTSPDPVLGASVPKVDPEGWRLVVGEDSHGQHKWVWLEAGERRDSWKQSTEDRYWLGLDTVSEV